ncbi:MAG: hypothetical protein KF745_09270 [Phycisphaeraceae bacterium]|nr:hypothetical protein [Phycisphaeraceae bacterium]
MTVFRRLSRVGSLAASALSLAVTAAWIAGRVATDRWLLTQLVFWVPSLWMLGAAAVLAGVALLAARLGREPRREAIRRERGRLGLRAARIALGAAMICIVALGAGSWRLWRWAWPPAAPPPERTFTMLHWNLSAVSKDFDAGVLADLPGAGRADLLLLTSVVDPLRLGEAVERLDPAYRFSRIGPFNVASRVEVRDTRLISLKLPTADAILSGETSSDAPPKPRGRRQKFYNELMRSIGVRMRPVDTTYPGYLLSFTADTTATLGRPITVWFIDLPSSPLAPRYAIAEIAARAIAELPGPPDVLVGDFNIPRGSASLSLLSSGMRHAYDDAAYGPFASWPRADPLFQIDHVFLGPGLRAVEYDLVDPGVSEHWAQEIVVADQAGR